MGAFQFGTRGGAGQNVMWEVQAVIGISPFESPDVGLVASLAQAGALGVLDLGHDVSQARAALVAVARKVTRPFGVRIPEHFGSPVASSVGDANELVLPAQARVVIVPASSSRFVFGDRTVLAQARSIEEARDAIARGAHGLIVKGHEASGLVADETSFVLLQRVLAETSAPVWVQGGVGLHTAAACIAAGARGVVLDAQLALLEDAGTSPELRRALSAMDGSETVVVGGYRLYARANTLAAPSNSTPAQIAASLGARDPASQLITLGQDAAFARAFAERFGTVERAVRGLHTAIEGHLHRARALRPLAPGSPFAQSIGTELPIVQGPMTRVSDRAAFAEAVADGGGLPFLALSLMRGPDARALLEQTRERLGGKPWGVGILGFLPPELREEQLALVTELRPPVALIAGGRPSQAAPLEKVGISTFLHVPSPGLLDLFWKEGARKFVFEGRECGGHVGPRSSFVLWDAVIERLLTHDRLHDVSVLFAGGIHDARSAAMVAALAAPLAARGAKVGVLMGTAYLFTEEAVACGAITEAFQDEAMRCTRTALLETAPGHATRCTDNEFVRTFERERARLEGEGLDAQSVWAALEQLNLGRLRIAAKGLRRDGDKLVDVAPAEQLRDGMFMIGQVAALRTARCTIDELHRDVSEGGTALLAAAPLPVAPKPRQRGRVDVAIVGMACIFPDAPDLESYWTNVVFGRSAVREVPHTRWNPELYFDPNGTGDKTPSKWGGFIPETIFDPGSFGIPPRSLASIDPVQILSLEVARRALDDAGYHHRSFDRERASVIFGAEGGTDLANAYGFRASYPQYLGAMPKELDDALPKLTEDSFPGVLGNVIAGRIANRLDLRGANYTVDAACASSLAAIDVACKELAAGSSDLVLAGGADLHNGIHDFLMFASVHALSAKGQCRPFDSSADGIALGEGVAAVVLKRLDDAERDGDRIYAVLEGVGASSDGKSLGLTAPRKEGQLRALERAYACSDVSPRDVGLVEAHGTGTVVGDRTELSTLTEFFGDAGASVGACTLGSVKSQIGHTKCAAGMAGLIKAALAVHRAVLPPTMNVASPNAAYDSTTSPFVMRTVAAPWSGDRRTAAVSAFGFGGTNFHAVLRSHAHQPPARGLEGWPVELFVVRGRTHQDAMTTLDAVEKIAQSDLPPTLRDLAAGVARENADAPVRCSIVASSLADLRAKLPSARQQRDADGVFVCKPIEGSLAFMFPGQGSQRPSMLADLFVAFPALRDLVELGKPWLDRLFPGTAFTPELRTAQQKALTDTRVAQPTLGLADLAMSRVLSLAGVRPAMTAGHSYGELVALSVAGAFDAETLLALSEQRARCILDAAAGAPGTMAAVRASASRIREVLGDDAGITLANHNAPDQTVIAGSHEAIERACQRLTKAGESARAIPVACAFHSPIVARGRESFAEKLAAADVHAPTLPVYANATAARYRDDAADVRETLAAQIASPVRFVEEVEAMYAAGARVFVEVGPGGVLTDLVSRILKGRPHVAIACSNGDATPAVSALIVAFAKLLAAGVSVDVDALFRDRATPVDLGAPEKFAAAPTSWVVDGGNARPLRGELPAVAMRLPAAPISLVAATPAVVEGDRESIVREYLRTTRELIEGQRQVMMQYLGKTSVQPREPKAKAVDVKVVQQARALAVVKDVKDEPAKPKLTPLAALIATVSERTGYPPDMLDPNLDLEADLGIDSIKRIEILGALRDTLGLRASGEASSAIVEELATKKTLGAIAALLEAHLQRESASEAMPDEAPITQRTSEASAPPTSRASSSSPPPSSPSSSSVGRYVVEVDHAQPLDEAFVSLQGCSFAIAPDRLGVAARLASLLETHGARARLLRSEDPFEDADGLIYLETIAADSRDAVRSLFVRAQEATRAKARWVIAATSLGGRFGHHLHSSNGVDSSRGSNGLNGSHQPNGHLNGSSHKPNGLNGSSGENGHASRPPLAAVGVSGFLKSFAKEWPSMRVRAIDLDPNDDVEKLAQQVFGEIRAADDALDVGYVDGVRQKMIVAARPSSIPPPSPLVIDDKSVVLLTGGARGITAQVAVAMAKRFRCTLELVGRTPLLPDDGDQELARALDAPSIRRLLVSRVNGAGPVSPSAIDAQCKQILGSREIRATLEAIRSGGGRVGYHAVDVRDDVAFEALIDALRDKHGRIDGVVHGAGLVEDKLLADKSHESFDRVFSTKVAGAMTLARKLSKEARFFVLFSSVSATFGNRGQTDYAAANDALDKLAHHLHRSVAGRVLSINWGPWHGIGMVRPELEREYARRGIALIAPEDGVERFFEELLSGSEPQVILTASSPALG